MHRQWERVISGEKRIKSRGRYYTVNCKTWHGMDWLVAGPAMVRIEEGVKGLQYRLDQITGGYEDETWYAADRELSSAGA